ncbi:MBL fold metallo-hydrolase [Evansella sp. AB-P1]|uniref:MBL fold metallo-hydrolase n=1 Tax=Evansella sp. AB-P1 TaxID=3037653 RepID=UPI002420359E|nr:MBL fold metallo-hydrolase [Evansella sp. AB-P1]MDG5787145.1 MBL fold metallo-hydrolase [Evansella sp. AB-P1]
MFQRFTMRHFVILFAFFLLVSGCGQGESNQLLNVSEDELVEEETSSNTNTEENDEKDTEANNSNNEIEEEVNPPNLSGELEVHFMDVGQGDATLLKGPDFTILIDAGRHDRNDVVPYLQNQNVSTIDLLIGTHPHADHIGQMDKVIQAFDVKEVWMSGDEHTTQTFERVLDAILASDADYHEPRAGESYTFGSIKIEVVNPDRLTGDFHEGSISVRAAFGDVSFLFTGDAEHQTERAMIDGGHHLKAEIFQLGHHGSSTSNTEAFLNAVNPEITIYSAGEDNSYGHPHSEVVERINNLGIPLYGTDVHGRVLVRTDGSSYSVHTEKSGAIVIDEQSQDDNNEPAQNDSKEEAPQSNGCIDINHVSRDQLMEIIHIGETRADELIRLRPFQSINGLTRINGIGDGRLNDIKNEGLACVK